MNSFLGFGSQYVDRHHSRAGQRAYLHITRTRKAKVMHLIFLWVISICAYTWHVFAVPLYVCIQLISTNWYSILFSQKEDDNNSGSGHPPKKKPTRLAIGECPREHAYKQRFYQCPLLRLCLSSFLFLFCLGIEGGFDVEQDQYEEDVKVVILPDRQEVTSEDLATMPDVVRERVRCVALCFLAR